jgi:hypothetical protein
MVANPTAKAPERAREAATEFMGHQKVQAPRLPIPEICAIDASLDPDA